MPLSLSLFVSVFVSVSVYVPDEECANGSASEQVLCLLHIQHTMEPAEKRFSIGFFFPLSFCSFLRVLEQLNNFLYIEVWIERTKPFDQTRQCVHVNHSGIQVQLLF